MNEFEKRWQECAARARQEARADEQAPPGFATRVLALSAEKQSASPLEILFRMTLRTLGCATTLLLALVVLEAASSHSSRMKVPHIENTVAQVFWLL
jgi:hypothetical protein